MLLKLMVLKLQIKHKYSIKSALSFQLRDTKNPLKLPKAFFKNPNQLLKAFGIYRTIAKWYDKVKVYHSWLWTTDVFRL